jgi:hypothetical protein
MRTPLSGCAFIRMIPGSAKLEGSLRTQKGQPQQMNYKQMKILPMVTSISRSPWRCGFFILPIALCWFALSPTLEAGCPNPPGGCVGQNTAVGDNALFNNTGVWNVGVGFQALFNNTDGNQNTGIGYQALFSNVSGDHSTGIGGQALQDNTTGSDNVGVGFQTLSHNTTGNRNTGMGYRTLAFNTTDSDNTAIGWNALFNNRVGARDNTAVGSQALFSNNSGIENTAVGFQALTNNSTAIDNAAFGLFALLSNVDGSSNTALGTAALRFNVSGSNNQAVGRGALRNSLGSGNIAIGREAGAGLTTVDNNIIVGPLSGVHSRFGQTSNTCFIANIYGAGVNNMGGVARFVIIDPDGKLGTVTVAADGILQDESSPQGIQPAPDAPEEPKQAKLERKVETLQATVTQQQTQIETLTAQLKEQAAQIQKVSAQLEVNKPAPQVVAGTR